MATKVLDITKEHFPMTFVKTKIELSKLQSGDILEVLLTEGEPLDNVPRNAKEQGYNVLSVEHVEGTTHRVTIKKKKNININLKHQKSKTLWQILIYSAV